MATNARILGAILNKWAQPLVHTFLGSKVQSLPFVQNVESKIRSMGWVSPRWTLMGELSPLMENLTGNLIAPVIENYLSRVDDASIPRMAHIIVDDAIKTGELRLFEGKIIIDRDDIRQLKRLLELNLPFAPEEEIMLKTE